MTVNALNINSKIIVSDDQLSNRIQEHMIVRARINLGRNAPDSWHVLETGIMENKGDGPAITLLRANRQLRDILVSKGLFIANS